MRTITITLVALLALGATSSAVAQAVPADSGQVVRVAVRAGPTIEGILVRQTPEQLVVRVAAGDTGAHTLIPLREVETVATSTYVRSGSTAARGFFFGMFGGAILGGIVAGREYNSCVRSGKGDGMCGMANLAVPALAIVGGFVGLMAGSSQTTAQWSPIWPSAPPR